MTILLTKNLRNIALDVSVPFVDLGWRDRHRSRIAVVLSDGRGAAVILPRQEPIRDGDILQSEDGIYVTARSIPEPILEIRAQTHMDLMRVIYHLANRHCAMMLLPDAVYVEPDPVLAQLAQSLGGIVTEVTKIFEPERGAYQSGHHGHHQDLLAEEDRALGNIGEALSRAAHESTR